MIGIGLLLSKLEEILKDEFSEFGRPVSEQKQIKKQSEPLMQTLKTKREAEIAPSAAAPFTPSQPPSVERVTPKQQTVKSSKAVAL